MERRLEQHTCRNSLMLSEVTDHQEDVGNNFFYRCSVALISLYIEYIGSWYFLHCMYIRIRALSSTSRRLSWNLGWNTGGTRNNGNPDSRSEHTCWNSFMYSKDINLQEDVAINSSANAEQLPYV